ncbi:MAG: ATP-dependent DNA helicase RecG [Chloroflexota bacterium]|nr:ATP-dependent DNA helicase RecG [Chloroflexota bacterium]
MGRSIDKLYKILKLEAEFGYTNKAVVGGLEKFSETWAGEARSEGNPEENIQQVVVVFTSYPNLSVSERAQALKKIGYVLDIPGLKYLPDPQAAETESNDSQPVQSQPEAENQDLMNPNIERGSTRKRVNTPVPTPQNTATFRLDAPTTSVRGVGEKQSQLLAKLDLYTIENMIYFFPHRYDDYSKLKLIKDLTYGEEVTILAWVKNASTFATRNKKRKIVQAIVSDNTGNIQLMWFNQEYHLRYLRKNTFLSISGKIEQYMGRLVMYHPDYEQINQEQLHTKRIVPIYSLTARLSQRWLRRVMYHVVNEWAHKIPEFMTEYILKDANLIDLSTALKEIHFPESIETLKQARYRLSFDEIFLLQLGVLRQKYEWSHLTGRVFSVEDAWLLDQIRQLPFTLTHAQMKVLEDMRHDLVAGHPMNRLLQGDVGSGKTVIAALAISIVLTNEAQAAFMAPTSILAEQHYATLKRLLTSPEIQHAALKENQIRLLIGDTPQKDREEILTGLADGSIKLVIGTHALIEEPVVFNDLQIAIIDEQHRFGVSQRATLREKGENPHLLVMTATPIPRSLALTIYGDLDVSVMDEVPPGRQPVETHIVYPLERERIYTLIQSQVEKGHQAFVIYPLVEKGENEESMAAVEEHERLQSEVFPKLRVGLLHGRLRPDDKDKIMRQFRNRDFDILVSTSVVEVGVDIPNATVMVIEGANRFGLAQLHQFRGRVGRGSDKSYCILIPETSDAAENERLLAMESTNDGFELAEYDLHQRGPGEFLGTRQSGYTTLRLANITDVHLIEKAQYYAQQVLENDPKLSAPEHERMLDALDHFWPFAEGDMS